VKFNRKKRKGRKGFYLTTEHTEGNNQMIALFHGVETPCYWFKFP